MVNRLFRQPWFPVIFQLGTLCVFVIFIRLGWNMMSRSYLSMLHLRYTNLANLVVWNFWWPAVIFGAVLFGRLWCTVCPMELIQNILSRIGLKRKPPRWLKSCWLITILFGIILIIGTHTYSIRQIPSQMSVYMLSLLGLTVLFSLVFEKRTFCSYVCPVGHLLGLCATFACTEWRVKDRAVCDSCHEKPCINKKRNNAWYGRACQSNLFPGSLADNRDCILCGQCIKACPNRNVTFRLRWPLADLFRGITLKGAQAAFMIMIIGHSFLGIIGEWNVSSAWFHTPFAMLNEALSVSEPWDGTVNAVLILVLIPWGLFLLMTSLSSWIDERRFSPSKIGVYLAAFIPVVATTLLAKSVFTPLSRLQNIPTTLTDPYGLHTAHLAAANMVTFGGDWQLVLNDVARYISAGIIVVGFVLTVVLLDRIPRKKRFASLPFILFALSFASITFGVMIGSALEANYMFVEPYNPCGA